MACWERLRFEIPYVAMDVAANRERFRVLRENVDVVVREYNGILDALAPQERGSSERLHYLDRKIVPGLGKLTWASKRDRRLHQGVRALPRRGQARLVLPPLQGAARQVVPAIGSTPLISLKKKQVYPQELFESEQRRTTRRSREAPRSTAR